MKEVWKQLTARYSRNRYKILFFSLLFTLAGVPLASALPLPGEVIEFLLLLNLLTAAFGTAAYRARSRLLLGLACAAALRMIGGWMGLSAVATLSQFLWIVLAVDVAVVAVRFALIGRSIDSEHVFAALSAYLLAGHFYGFVYWTLEETWPGSFLTAGQVMGPGKFSLQDAFYFSFVTIATLGYGDIVPFTPVARGFAITEAIAGQLYIAVLVARLVSAQTASS